jgi:hypothetical protein
MHEDHMKPINTLYRLKVESFNVKAGVTYSSHYHLED